MRFLYRIINPLLFGPVESGSLLLAVESLLITASQIQWFTCGYNLQLIYVEEQTERHTA